MPAKRRIPHLQNHRSKEDRRCFEPCNMLYPPPLGIPPGGRQYHHFGTFFGFPDTMPPEPTTTSLELPNPNPSWVALAPLVVSHTLPIVRWPFIQRALCISHMFMFVIYGWFKGHGGLRSG